MSTIWTPSGEQPIRREPEGQPSRAAAPEPDELSEEELQAHLAQVQRQLVETPAEVVVANHCIGLFQLAVLHLEQSPPHLPEAQLAIDALGAIVEGLGPRLGEEEAPLREALTQLRMAFVQRRGTSGPPPAGE
ncbi:MAG: hypothetical protein ABR540_07680 [Acidimicrobiales bacterium]